MLLRPFAWIFVFFGLLAAANSSSADSRRCRRVMSELLALPKTYLGQLHPDLRKAYAGSQALCGPVCMTNAARLARAAEGEQASSMKNAIEETIDRIESLRAVAPRSDAYDPRRDGVSFELMLKGLASPGRGFDRARFRVKSEDQLPNADARRLETFFRRNPRFESRAGRIVARDLRDRRIDFFILSFVELDANRGSTDFVHAVLAVYDAESGRLHVLDPYFPDEPSTWEFIGGAKDYRLALRRKSGKYANGAEEVAVHDFIGFILEPSM